MGDGIVRLNTKFVSVSIGPGNIITAINITNLITILHKIGYFGDILPSQSLGLVLEN